MKIFRTLISVLTVWALAFITVFGVVNIDTLTTNDVIYGLLIFTAPGGAATAFSFNMTYLPEFLRYNAGANQLTSLRVETQEDGVLHDWTLAGLNAMNGFNKLGAQTANDTTLRLSDGELRPKNVTISGVTSAAGAVGFFVCSDNKGTVPLKSSNAAILALNPTLFENFTAVFIPTMATATDYAEITFDDGHVQRFEMEDLRSLSSNFQQVEGIIINNIAGNIRRAMVRTAAATPAYILSVKI